MTTIKANCPYCGEVELSNRDMLLKVCNSHPRLSCYLFTCPECQEEIRKPADQHIIDLLMSGGVPVELFVIPAEVFEPHEGPPISWDDLIDFHEKLASV